MDLNIDKVLKDRYKIGRKLSVGQFSVLYLAEDLTLKKPVVLKLFPIKQVNFKNLSLTFQNELKITAQLKHRNIVKLHDYFTTKHFFVIVLEYIEGITLRTLLTIKRCLGIKTAVSYFLQILDALNYAYLNNIIHRDLKPSNILVVNNKTIKILDFGIALNKYKQNRLFTENLAGTIHYLSPESIQDRSLIGIQSDLYAIGIMLFEVLIGHQPFFSSDPIEILNKHLYEPFPRISQFDNHISLMLENIIIRATAKNLSERYHNPNDMLIDLQKYTNNPNQMASPILLKSEVYQGKVNFTLKSQNNYKKPVFFWLTKRYLFLFIFLNCLIFIALLVGVIYRKFN